jgi:methylmalonyl-CoA/ethylmalonyl-CoA epimerase
MQTEPLNLFGPGAAFHHVGLVVASIDAAAIPNLQKTHDPIQKVNVAFTDLHGTVVELIEPAGPDSPVSANLKKGIKLVHLCVSVPNIEQAIAFAEAKEMRQLSEPVPAVAFNGRRIAWLFHPTYGLFELLEQ